MMKLSRELFPTLLEEKGLLSGIFLDNFNPSKTLYDDIKKDHLEKEFKNRWDKSCEKYKKLSSDPEFIEKNNKRQVNRAV